MEQPTATETATNTDDHGHWWPSLAVTLLSDAPNEYDGDVFGEDVS